MLCATALVLLSACTKVVDSSVPQAPLVPEPVEPVALPDYRVQVGDTISIKFLLAPELDEQVVVRPDGRISTAAARDVMAYGHTIPELNGLLRPAYKALLKSPDPSVVLQSVAPVRIYVDGEVLIPGEFISEGKAPTLSQALARAGGVKVTASPSNIFIIRRGPDEHPVLLATRYADLMSASNPDADVRLAPSDVVFVPKTAVATVYQAYNQYVQQFVPVGWNFSYLLNQPANVSSAATKSQTLSAP